MKDRDLCSTPATELTRLYRARKVSPLEVTEAVLARIDALRAAAAFEAAAPWADKLPPLSLRALPDPTR